MMLPVPPLTPAARLLCPPACRPAAPAGRSYTVSIAVAASCIENAQNLELATLLAGQVARAAAIFNVDEVRRPCPPGLPLVRCHLPTSLAFVSLCFSPLTMCVQGSVLLDPTHYWVTFVCILLPSARSAPAGPDMPTGP